MRLRLWCSVCILFLVSQLTDKSLQSFHQSILDIYQDESKNSENRMQSSSLELLRCILFKTEGQKQRFIPNLKTIHTDITENTDRLKKNQENTSVDV